MPFSYMEEPGLNVEQPKKPNFFQQLGQNFMNNMSYGTTPEWRNFNLQRRQLEFQKQKMAQEQNMFQETQRHNRAQEGLTGQRTGAMTSETARKTEEDKWQRIGAAFKAANDVINHTDDTDAANTVLQSFFKDDPNPPIKGVQFSKKNKILQWKLDDGDFIINQPDFQKMMEAVGAGGDIRQGLTDAEGKGIGVFIKHGAKPKSEHEKVVESQGAERIGIEREKVRVQREKAGVTKFKEQKIAELWPTLSEDEQKRIIGARIDPKDLTEKNIIDVYGNIMTDPSVKKALQPIAEKIMQKATEKGGPAKELDEVTAKKILLEAGGDKVKARKLAKDRGFKF